MKKVSAIFLFVPFLFVCSCAGAGGGGGDSSSTSYDTTVSISVSATWSYSSSNDIFVLNENVKSLTIEGDIAGKTLYCAEVNASASDIGTSYIKYISSATARSVSDGEMPEVPDFSDSSLWAGFSHPHFYDYEPPAVSFASSSRTIDNPASPGTKANQISSYVDGSTTKTLWIAKSESEYDTAKATLRAHNGTCNVWVVDDWYTSGTESATDGKVNSSTARKFADAFAKLYPVVRNVFGEESDKIYYPDSSGWIQKEMNYLSDTGTKVNIVIYDLFGDQKKGSTLGFFNGVDYYPTYDDFKGICGYEVPELKEKLYSNEGKYFYVDSFYAISEPNMIVSTLAHEFQHMIHFCVKKMKGGLDSDTNFNEMLSMLCEDMMQSFLTSNGYTISDEDSPKGRLVQFMIQYYGLGIRSFKSGSALDYANAYAFGSWLCRQYGGAALVKEMMTNGKTNNDCIVAAVNSISGKSYTFEDLFAQFIKACYGKDSEYTFNRDAAKTLTCSSGGTTYAYAMTKIDLWGDSMYSLANVGGSESAADYFDSEYKRLGPAVFTYNALHELPATYGMFLKRVASIKEGGSSSAYLLFTSKSGVTKPGMKLFLYIK